MNLLQTLAAKGPMTCKQIEADPDCDVPINRTTQNLKLLKDKGLADNEKKLRMGKCVGKYEFWWFATEKGKDKLKGDNPNGEARALNNPPA